VVTFQREQLAELKEGFETPTDDFLGFSGSDSEQAVSQTSCIATSIWLKCSVVNTSPQSGFPAADASQKKFNSRLVAPTFLG
jgi:hypothetical protein